MRGIETSKTSIRHQVFTEAARFAYENGTKEDFAMIPCRILPRGQSRCRADIFLERAILGERLQAAMGMPVRTADQAGPLFDGIEQAEIGEHYYNPPRINVIPFACNACPERHKRLSRLSGTSLHGSLSQACGLYGFRQVGHRRRPLHKMR